MIANVFFFLSFESKTWLERNQARSLEFPFPFKISFHLRINNLIFFYQMSLIENKMIRKMKERKGKAVLSQRLLDHD